ncbi:hypothetical protein ABW21_db0203923 [Orbilia brochopaga]|nr:hypothetical protein ABW21_db0203923 [Drechslerella brochopaga]
MSSNPFRRKQNDGTPSASGRTSLDIDQERLQQVAQQAFADADDELQPTGTSGTTPPRESPPPYTKTETVAKEDATPPLPRDDSSHDGPKGDTPEASENERRPSPPREVVEDVVIATPPVSTATISGSPTRSPDAAVPVPPVSRPSAPPAPPRPRRSVRRPRTEPIEEKVLIVEKPVEKPAAPVTPPPPRTPPKKADDPFSEWKVISARPESEDETPRPSPARDDSGWEKVEALVESESSEYEEDSASEISEPPTISSASLISKPSTSTSEPENLDISTSIQPPNPFRKKDDGEVSLPRSQTADADLQENIPPAIRFGVQHNPTPTGVKAARQSLNVDAFKHLMLTGQAAHNPEPITATETTALSKQSLPESVEPSYSPRSSQDTGRSAPDAEEADGKPGPPATPPSKAKPPPPKPRGQRNSMMMPPPPYRLEPQSIAIREKYDVTVSAETASSPPKTPKPPAPISRRMSTQVPIPPPPPPSRRPASSPKDQPTTPPGQSREQPPQLTLNVSPMQAKKPAPPPARRASKRMSMPPGHLQAYSQNSTFTPPINSSRGAGVPAPPPPPIRKKTQLSHSTTDGQADPLDPPPRSSSSFDILEDLTKLQQEVNELMERV